MEVDYLKKYYRFERQHWWFRVREKIIRQELQGSLIHKSGLAILNAGAATGRSSEMLSQFGKVVSVEKDPEACAFLRTELQMEVFEADLVKLPFQDNSFDLICAFDVLEHIDDDGAAMLELQRVCKPGGQFYCTVPAFSFLWSRHDEINHHRRRYRKRSLKKLVGRFFKVEYSTYFNFLLFIPIAITRLFLNLIPARKTSESDFEYSPVLNGGFFSAIFGAIFSIEVPLLRLTRLPFGLSILLRAKKSLSPQR